MTTDSHKDKPKLPALGADFLIPALAVAFTIYYFGTIWDLSWEARADGLGIGICLLILIAVLLVRIGLQVMRGKATLGMDKLIYPLGFHGRRWSMAAAIFVFIAVLPYLGLTLAVFLLMSVLLLILGVRKPLPLLAMAFGMAAGQYFLFIVLLNARFPRGPVENILSKLF